GVHLLAGVVDARGLERLAGLALERGVAAICARELARAHQRFGTVIPESVLERLGGARREPTAAYLEPDRSWRHELASNVGALGSWSERLRLLREVAFPSPAYMLRSYGIGSGALGFAVLPALYLHRATRGVWRVMTGKK